MKSLIAIFAIALGGATAAWPAPPAVLTTLRAIHALTNEEASHRLPVAFEATATYYLEPERTLFVQDAGLAIYVQASGAPHLEPGDRVLIKGSTRKSFHPFVMSDSITVLRHEPLPDPVHATFTDLIHSRYDCRLVSVHGRIISADQSYRNGVSHLHLYTAEGGMDATLSSSDDEALTKLLDSEVEITAVASGIFDGKMQQTGVLLHVSTLADVKILSRASTSPWALPLTPMDSILTGYRVNDLTPRIRVQGTVTYYEPGAAIVLQSGTQSLWIMTNEWGEHRIGSLVSATGIPGVHDGFLTLTHAEIHQISMSAPVKPHPATWSELAESHNIFDLVAIEGQVVTEVREAAQDQYVLTSHGHLFTAIIRHPRFAMKQIPPGSRVRVTGICMQEDSNPFDHQVPFDILMRSFDDITVVARPSLVNTRNLLLLIGILLIVVFAVIARGWALEHKVRRQTAAMSARTEAEAELERRRSRILEEISGTRPLVEILEEIAAMVSFMLHEAPCWCEIADGARLGNCPPHKSGLRVIQMEISGHAGLALGTLFAALDPLAPPDSEETPALSVGTRLATLAIETRHLYSDLRRRSEFDLLTDIHNRFSLESQLDALIEAASGEASREEGSEKAVRFGLIYIDLDEFKQVNDRYGHHIGDLYLQEVVLRMKHQLRSHDMLARLGGDEFAALLTEAHSRADIEEIAQRLKSCFDAPFVLDGNQFHGSASVGFALYPADGASKDSLLGVADAAMYRAKNRRRKTDKCH